MPASPTAIVKDLVLIGGGHTHAIALKLFGMNPLPGLRVTLISNLSHTPYSGMLPGHVAGFYSFDETHIDLRRLARFAGAQFYLDEALGLDLATNRVLCTQHPPVAFDYLSIDIGSTPETISATGAAEYATPVKPVPHFLQIWEQLLAEVALHPDEPLSIAIVGGGAGGVELALNMQPRLQQVINPDRLEMHLFHRGCELVTGLNRWVSRRVEQILTARGVQIHLQETVTEVWPDKLVCESGLTLDFAGQAHRVFWVTKASAPDWIAASGLATDAKGFVLVDDSLRSISHPHVFAVGDIATMQNHPRPKAGVFAVRQGKPLFTNLRRAILSQPLETYIPQARYLSLIGTGDQRAIALWGALGWHSWLLWVWKDRIDRKFMQRFAELPEMPVGDRPSIKGDEAKLLKGLPKMYCAGCGAKVGSPVLDRVLQRLEILQSPDILVGLNAPDDAAVVRVPPGQLMVHTVDYFRSPINDPFIFGQIATNHCLGDLFAMGATPQSVLAVVTIPYGVQAQQEETLYQLLAGASQILQAVRTPLVGGHTTEGDELAFGLACNGFVTSEQLRRKGGMKPGQVLILTKPLGTGALLAADMRYQAKGRWIDGALESMVRSNQAAAQIFLAHGVTALTDVTGFGLIGHLIEMVRVSGVAVELELESIPILEGAIATVEKGITSSLQPLNLRSAMYLSNAAAFSHSPRYPLLFDPQTAGGLLGAVPAQQMESCLHDLRASGDRESCAIARVVPLLDPLKLVTRI